VKVLTVISEVIIKSDGSETVDRSFNIITNEYSKFFDKVNIIGPGEKDFEFVKGLNPKVFYTSTTLYAKPIKSRLKYYLNAKKAKAYFKNIIERGDTEIVQIRIPSLFSLMAFSVVKRLKLPLTTYIAGEWYSSFVANYTFIGSKVIANILDNYQKKIIRDSVPVSAGKEITFIYKKINDIYPYFSTTHKEVIRSDKDNPILQLLYVGTLETRKRVVDAISTVKLLKDKKIKVIFNIVGHGVERKNLEIQVKELGLDDSVIFHGHISDTNKLEDQYKNADMFIFPSISEGTPKVLAEAMSYGAIPIAVKSTGSIRFIIEDNNNGFLVDAYSPSQMADKVTKVLNSKELQQKMQNFCYVYAEKHTITNEVNNLWQHVFSELKKIKK
jgi:glycosyltransferase involved in cell wall biosynthesis